MSIGAGECWDWGVRLEPAELPGYFTGYSLLELLRGKSHISSYKCDILEGKNSERFKMCLELFCLVHPCYWPWVAHLTLEVSSAPRLSLLQPTPDQVNIPFYCQRYPSLQKEKFPLVHHEYFWTSQPTAFPCTSLCMELDCAIFL